MSDTERKSCEGCELEGLTLSDLSTLIDDRIDAKASVLSGQKKPKKYDPRFETMETANPAIQTEEKEIAIVITDAPTSPDAISSFKQSLRDKVKGG